MYARTPDGKVSLALIAGGKRLALVTPTLQDRRYTVVASTVDKRIVLRTFPDGPARAGNARVRAVHVVPELDEADFSAGSNTLGQVGRARRATTPPSSRATTGSRHRSPAAPWSPGGTA